MSLDHALTGAADWTEPGPLAEMTPADHERREVLVATVWRNLHGFMEAGAALIEIRDSRLYRDTHPTFAAFCKDEFSLTRSGAYELMAAAEVVSGIPDTAPRPENVGQARALAAADPAERADVMAAVAATGKSVTAAAITDEIKARHPEPTPPAPSPAPPTVETGQVPPTAPPAPTAPGAQAEHEGEFCSFCGDEQCTCDRGVCVGCGAVDPPGFAGSHCVECWEASNPAPKAEKAPGPKIKTPREKAWEPVPLLDKALRLMPSARDAMAVVPAESVEEYDRLAERAIEWGKRWQEERKAAKRLRLMGVK